MPIEVRAWITREDLRDEPDTLFVFGDNMLREGKGGQAREMRGEPNAVGIPTQHAPGSSEDAYFTDADLEDVKGAIDEAFRRLNAHLAAGGHIVWPEKGVGTGLAQLPQRAPAIHAYIEEARKALQAAAAAGPAPE